MRHPDIVIAGAGLIGMACALECRRRGMSVTLLERGQAGQEASWAAAGMLAAHDPANPPALRQLSELSLALYPAFLEQLAESGAPPVVMETEWTLEAAEGSVADAVPAGLSPSGFHRVQEASLDPRKLTAAALNAVKSTGVTLREGVTVLSVQQDRHAVAVHTSAGILHCDRLIDCTGAWSRKSVRPVKGQMLRVHAPGALAAGALGNVVVRTKDVYLVPRLDGAVIIGATVEDAGFDKSLRLDDLLRLQQHAGSLLPVLAAAPVLEQWAGLRPGTEDGLPLLGPLQTDDGDSRIFVAAGHFRNGVLLAPATGHVMAQLLLGEWPSADLSAFVPYRAAATGTAEAETQRETAARQKMARWRAEWKPAEEEHRRPPGAEPLYWYARVTGVPAGKERCSYIDPVNFVYEGKRYVEEETVPDFLILRWQERGWAVLRGYTGSRRVRGGSYQQTFAGAVAYATSLTGGLLTPWTSIPKQFHCDLPAYAAMQQANEQRL